MIDAFYKFYFFKHNLVVGKEGISKPGSVPKEVFFLRGSYFSGVEVTLNLKRLTRAYWAGHPLALFSLSPDGGYRARLSHLSLR